MRNGQRQLTDGRYAEIKEMLGGYYLVDCANLDEAVHWAAQMTQGARFAPARTAAAGTARRSPKAAPWSKRHSARAGQARTRSGDVDAPRGGLIKTT
jgi:hypothetical protein